MSDESQSLKMPPEFKLNDRQRRALKDAWMARWHRQGEGWTRATSSPEVADLWLNASVDYLTSVGFKITKIDPV